MANPLRKTLEFLGLAEETSQEWAERPEPPADLGRSGVQADVAGRGDVPLGDGDLAHAKRKYGSRIFLKGNMDSVNVLLKSSVEHIRELTIEMIHTGAPGGGYILSTSCSVAPRVPKDHLKLLVDTADNFGIYE